MKNSTNIKHDFGNPGKDEESDATKDCWRERHADAAHDHNSELTIHTWLTTFSHDVTANKRKRRTFSGLGWNGMQWNRSAD